MTGLRTAAQQALEAYSGGPNWRGFADAMDALKAALAEPVQCADNDSPWLICKPCAAEGVCKKAEPQEPDSPERRCGGPGCDMRCCQPVQEPAGQLQEEAFGRGQVLWFKKPPDLSMLYTAPPQRPAEPVQEPQGCDHCNHPLYAATKCRVCGRVTEPTTEDSSAVETVQPVAHKHEWFSTGAMKPGQMRCIHCGVWNHEIPPQRPAEPVQEPVAWSHINGTSDTKWHPPQRLPLTSDKDRPDQGATYVEGYGYVDTRAVRAVERAHGIGGEE